MSTQKVFIHSTPRLGDFPLCLQTNQHGMKLGWCHDIIFFLKLLMAPFML